MFTIYIVLGLVALLVVVIIGIYNSLISRRNRIDEAWSDIEVQMKRRYDLIPNIVETVKGYAAHEKGIFENVSRVRAMAMGAKTTGEHAKAENMLTDTLKSLFAVAEAYPELKANTNFLELQRELSDTENKVQSARRFYNGNVRDYNTFIQSFPSNFIAEAFGFISREFFNLENEAEAKPVAVKF